MSEEDRERVREPDRTTIVTTDGGGRGGGTLLAVVLVIVLLVILFLVFGDRLGDSADELEIPEQIDVDVDVDAPQPRAPEIEIRQEPPATQPPPANQVGNSG